MPSIPSRRPPNAGFSLVEILVAIAIMALILVFVAQMVGGTSKTTELTRRRLDADAQARLIFDRMNVDFTRMVRASDIDYLAKGNPTSNLMPGNDRIAFFSSVPGYYSTAGTAPTADKKNPLSLVAYSMAAGGDGKPHLVRLAKGLRWESDGVTQDVAFLPGAISLKWPSLWSVSSTEYSGMDDVDFQSIGSGVVRMEYSYLMQSDSSSSGSLSISPFLAIQAGRSPADFYRDVAAIVVTLAIIDPKSQALVSDYASLTNNTLLADASNGVSVDGIWNSALANPGFAASAGLPKAVASAVKIYQRTFYLNSSPP